MGYELLHFFRQLEVGNTTGEEYAHLEQILNIINHYQGEEIRDLRENYVILFSQWEGGKPLCPLIASDFMHSLGQKYDPESFLDVLLDSGIPVNPDESLDSIINYLEYFSLLCETRSDLTNSDELAVFQEKHILSWMPLFCDVLLKASNISFYREVAFGLKNYLLQVES